MAGSETRKPATGEGAPAGGGDQDANWSKEEQAAAALELAERRRAAAEAAEARRRRHIAFAVWEAGINERYSLVAGRYEALLIPASVISQRKSVKAGAAATHSGNAAN